MQGGQRYIVDEWRHRLGEMKELFMLALRGLFGFIEVREQIRESVSCRRNICKTQG